jgi:hypothetical protein
LGPFFLFLFSFILLIYAAKQFWLLFIYLVSDHVTVNFARSGGPGGQNVNKGFFFLLFPMNLLFSIFFVCSSNYLEFCF